MPQSTMPEQFSNPALDRLLAPEHAHLDQNLVRENIQGRVVMVTGAAGSIGSELCRQIAACRPLAMVGLDQAETPLVELEWELSRKFPAVQFHAEIGSITRPDDINRTMAQFRPSIVYHAAAYKHVSLLEKHPFAAIENNVFGTLNVAQSAARHGVEFFVLISTDKAVRPASVLGVTKRIAELSISSFEKSGSTRFVSVRFGNVLGSSGSVVSIFKDQIKSGGPVTVTHPEMKRYFMTAGEACQLVLQAFVLGEGGETFLLDMGEPFKILDLAKKLIQLAGLQPEKEIKIQFTGTRPGEKLFEDLKLEAENLAPTAHPRIFSILSTRDIDAQRVKRNLLDLQHATEARNLGHAIQLLQELVPDYSPSAELLNDATRVQAMHSESSAASVLSPNFL